MFVCIHDKNCIHVVYNVNIWVNWFGIVLKLYIATIEHVFLCRLAIPQSSLGFCPSSSA